MFIKLIGTVLGVRRSDRPIKLDIILTRSLSLVTYDLSDLVPSVEKYGRGGCCGDNQLKCSSSVSGVTNMFVVVLQYAEDGMVFLVENHQNNF